MWVAITPPATPAAIKASSAAAAVSLCLCRRCRASSLRTLERAFGSTGWRTERGVLGGLGGLAEAKVWKSNSFDPGRRIAPVVLSDRTIARLLAEGRIEIDPYDDSLLQPSSVDVRVDRYFRVFHNNRYPFIDVREEQEDLTELVEVEDETAFVLHPGEFVLGSTLERVRLPDDLVARLEGKSSLGRLGLLIHSTAGFIDPGWDGHVTLELSNVANLPVTIYPGMKIGQISFVQLTEPAETPYGTGEIGSKYQGQRGPTPSRYWQNFQREPTG
jgi:dCTP deaminase